MFSKGFQTNKFATQTKKNYTSTNIFKNRLNICEICISKKYFLMNDHQYNTVSEIYEADKLLKDGVLIAERTEGFLRVFLYQADSFYLEVYRHSHFNVIIKVIRFTDPAHLDPYLNSIAIDSLLS